jgi:protein involved in polysaccharide export with SLBB domain
MFFGDVRTSGANPFRYGSTVKSAVAVAGGYRRATSRSRKSRHRQEADHGLLDVRQSFDELEATLPSAREIREVKLQHAGNLAGVEATRSISIARAQNGVATVLQATERNLRPGDVVEIRKLLRRGVSQPNAAATQASLLPYQIGAVGAEKQVGSTSQ